MFCINFFSEQGPVCCQTEIEKGQPFLPLLHTTIPPFRGKWLERSSYLSVFHEERHLHNQTPSLSFLGYKQSPWCFGPATSPMQLLSLWGKINKKKNKKRSEGEKKKNLLFFFKVLQIFYTLILFFFKIFFIFSPLLTFTQAKQQEGPLMNVADRHGYGSEMQQKAIMVGHSGGKKREKKKRNASLCQNFRTAVITLLHPNQCKVTEILWHVKCQRIKYWDFNVTLFKKTGSINFQLHFQLVKSSRGNREKGASPWHRASHFEV